MADRSTAPVLEAQRLDKWLWAARYFKTRSLAAQAIAGGKVHIDGRRTKPARQISPGACLQIRRGPMEWEVVVLRLAAQRRPAKEAAFLYEETKQSIERRAQEARRRKDERLSRQRELGRPSKRDRRRLASLKGR